MHLIPAYGRDYKSKAAVIADLKAGKDFVITSSPRAVPVNLPQITMVDFPLQVRYNGMRSVCVLQPKDVA